MKTSRMLCLVALIRTVAGICLMGSLVLVSQTHAQSAPPTPQKPGSEEVLQLEAFTVTGSNIKRMDVENVLPVTVVSRDVIEARSAVTPVELLTALPQVTNVPLNESAVGGLGARGDVASVNLRGIGSSNSLILLNGRRLAPHPQSSALSYSVNVNQLPTQGIQQIDVLRDGASAIYGSDAVAGVINYIMRKDFRRTELKLRYGYPEYGGGQNVQTTLTYGTDFAHGRGRLLSTLDYLYRDAIFLRDRGFSVSADHSPQAPPPFNVPGSQFDGRTTVGFYPTFRIGTSLTTNYFRPVNGVMTITSVGPTRANNPEYYYDSNTIATGSPRTYRVNWFNGIEFDINDRITAFADLSYYFAKSTIIRQPIQLNAPSGDALAPISVDNPFNPFGARFYNVTGAPNADGTARVTGAPRAMTLLSENIPGVPDERMMVKGKTYRVVAGLRGKLMHGWSWETGALFTRVTIHDSSPYNVRESFFQKALMRTDNTAFNPFGFTFKVQGGAVVADQPYTNPASVMSTIMGEWSHDGLSEIDSIDASASGPIVTLWSGDISLAVGSEYRREKFADTRPPFVGVNPPGSGLDPTDNDIIVSSPRLDNFGDRTVTSVYAETVIPLVAPKNDIPFMKSSELTASARHERYNDFGNTTKPKVGVNWKPFTTVMVRASFNEGFTAPSLPVLHQPSQFGTNLLGEIDTYRNVATNEGTYLMRSFSTGNPGLKPTNSKGKTAGVVFDVPKVAGLSLSADYWEIRQTDIIGSLSSAQVKDSDAALLTAYTNQQLAAGVPINSIDAGSGTAAYKGDPAVTRFTPTAADIAVFTAYNAANPGNRRAVVGQIFSYFTPNQNLAEGYARGLDFELKYSMPEMPIGKVMLDSEWSYLSRSYTIQTLPNTAPVYAEVANVNGSARWRGMTTASWRKGRWSGGLSAYYIGSFADSGATTTAAVYQSLGRPSYIVQMFNAGSLVYRYRVSDSLTFNAFVGYRFGSETNRWLRNSSVRAGVINLKDTKPPFSSGANGYSTSVYGTMLAGRTWTLELSKGL